LDSSGGATNGDYYVTTGSDGGFSITGDYACIAEQQVYLYAQGGNPGSAPNAALGLMAALGTCPASGNFLSGPAPIPYITINEVSTVAAAYAFAGFATDATHVSSAGTAAAELGIATAFANAANLETLPTGVALATTPVGSEPAPQAEINTLANILAACVNSDGTVTGPANPTPCYTLFNNASSGGSSGTAPTDTATAAINIAHNPFADVPALYGLASSPPPFSPPLSVQPNDFSMAICGDSGAPVLADSVTQTHFSLSVLNGAPTLTAIGNAGSAEPNAGLIDTVTGAGYSVGVTNGALSLVPGSAAGAVTEIGLTDSTTNKTYELAVVSGALSLTPN
jgi:hypothetical protein